MTDQLQIVFDDFVAIFNSFAQREEKLATLHVQAVKKSQELNAKMNMELTSAMA